MSPDPEYTLVENKEEEDGEPLKQRGCTDIICLLIFVVFLAGMGVLTWYAFSWGDPYRITNGYDSFGNVCGRNNAATKNENVTQSGRDMTDKPYLMYFDPTQMIPSTLATYISSAVNTGSESIETTMRICVKQCPNKTIAVGALMYQYKQYYETYNQSLCEYDYLEDQIAAGNNFPVTTADSKYIQNARGPCPSFVFKSDPVMSRCIPMTGLVVEGTTTSSTVSKLPTKQIEGGNGTNNISTSLMMQYAVSDVMTSYKEIIIMCVASIIISFIIILLLGWIAEIMIYTIGSACFITCILAPAYFVYTWYATKKAFDELPASEQLASGEENVTMLLYYALIMKVVCVIVALIILFLRKNARLMTDLFKEAGGMVLQMYMIVFTPILLALCIIAWAGLWVFVSSYIYTAGMETMFVISRNTLAGNITTMFYTDRAYTPYAWLYHLFGLYWGTEFLLAFHEMALAGAFVQFYWTRDKRSIHFPVLKGIWWVFRYHLGTVAFGSCIIGIVQLVRTILAYIHKITKDSESQFVKYFLMCLMCCMWCFKTVLKFINRNAYIYTAFKGSNFCQSAKKVWGLLMAKLVEVGVINNVGTFILFVGKFLVVIITVILGCFLMERDDALNYWAIPVLVAAIFSMAVAYCFFSVYEIGIETILICYAEDSTINDGTTGREFYMSENLIAWVDDVKNSKKTTIRQERVERAKKRATAKKDLKLDLEMKKMKEKDEKEKKEMAKNEKEEEKKKKEEEETKKKTEKEKEEKEEMAKNDKEKEEEKTEMEEEEEKEEKEEMAESAQ